MPTVVLKLIARQDTGWTDGQSGDYMLPFGKHNKMHLTMLYLCIQQCQVAILMLYKIMITMAVCYSEKYYLNPMCNSLFSNVKVCKSLLPCW